MDMAVEVTIRIYGWGSGESEVELSIPDAGAVGRLLAAVAPDEQGLVFSRLGRHVVAELADAFSELESPRRLVPLPT